MSDLARAREDFLEAKTAANRSNKTIEKYQLILRRLANITGNCPIDEIEARNVRKLLADLRRLDRSPSTLLTYYTSLKTFFTWCEREYNDLDHNIMHNVERPSIPKRLPPYLKSVEVQKLLEATKWDQARRTEKQQAILLLLLDTGIRSGELCALNKNDVNLERMEIRVLGKDQEERMLPISEAAKEALLTYWKMRSDSSLAAFNGRGGRMTTDGVRSLIRRLAERSGILSERRVYPHLMRHTFAHRWLTGNGDLESLRRLLGHSKLTTTQRYAGLAIEHLKHKHQKVQPLRDLDL
jgi:site-specific recombinase XerD